MKLKTHYRLDGFKIENSNYNVLHRLTPIYFNFLEFDYNNLKVKI